MLNAHPAALGKKSSDKGGGDEYAGTEGREGRRIIRGRIFPNMGEEQVSIVAPEDEGGKKDARA